VFGSNNLPPPECLQPKTQRESFKMAAIIAESRLLAQRFMQSEQANMLYKVMSLAQQRRGSWNA
jgi:hypothetical protein